MKILLPILIVIISIANLPSTSNAYFQVPLPSSTDLMVIDKQIRKSKKWNNHFVVYDDFSVGVYPQKEMQILHSYNECYLGFDKININIPYFSISQILYRSDFTLENLLSTNLKLKMLIDDYNEQKKRSKELLQAMKVPFLDENTIFQDQPRYVEAYTPTVQNLNQEINILQRGLHTQRRRYNQSFTPIRLSNNKSKGKPEDVSIKEKQKVTPPNDTYTEKQRVSSEVDETRLELLDSNVTTEDDYPLVVSHSQKDKKGITATLLIWIVGFYTFATKEPLIFMVLMSMVMFALFLTKTFISNMRK